MSTLASSLPTRPISSVEVRSHEWEPREGVAAAVSSPVRSMVEEAAVLEEPPCPARPLPRARPRAPARSVARSASEAAACLASSSDGKLSATGGSAAGS